MRLILVSIAFLAFSFTSTAQEFYMEAGGLGSKRFAILADNQESFNIKTAGFYLEFGSELFIFDKGTMLWAIGYSYESGNGSYSFDTLGSQGTENIEDWKYNNFDMSYMYVTDYDSKFNALFSGSLGLGFATRNVIAESQKELYFMFPTLSLEAGLLFTVIENLDINLMLRGGGNYNLRIIGSSFQPMVGFGLGLRYTIVE